MRRVQLYHVEPGPFEVLRRMAEGSYYAGDIGLCCGAGLAERGA